jgi:hypothetical protein
MASFKMKQIIANLSMRQRVAFVVSSTILVVGIFGGLVALSHHFASSDRQGSSIRFLRHLTRISI